MTLAEAIAVIDERAGTRSESVRDSWRIVRGDLRRAERSERPSVQIPAVVPDEPITAKQRFANVTEDLVKVKEEIEERGGRGDGG